MAFNVDCIRLGVVAVACGVFCDYVAREMGRVRAGAVSAALWAASRLIEVSWWLALVAVVMFAALLVAVCWFVGAFVEALMVAETMEDLWQ